MYHSNLCPCKNSNIPTFQFIKSKELNHEGYICIKWNCLKKPHCDTFINLTEKYNNCIKTTEKRSLFLTLSFGSECNIMEKINVMNIAVKNSCLPPYIYCYEFFNSEQKPHFHIHILMNLGSARIRKQRIIQKYSKLFKLAPNFINYKFSNNLNRYNQLYEYICGKKTDKKQKSVDMDIEKRESLGLQNYYIEQ